MTSQTSQTGWLAAHSRNVAEIGSEFELVEIDYLTPATSRPLPWEDSADIIYVESGRQALAIVEAELRRQGHTQIHVPSYFCDSMLGAFQGNGWILRELPLNNDLFVRPEDLLSPVTSGVLLHAPYFGRQDSPAMLNALDTLRGRGVVIVVDETHRVLSGPSPVADIRVASVRKLLPLYDGGYVAGLPGRLCPIRASSQSQAPVLRKAAMRAKSDALFSGDGSKAHLELFATAERVMQTREVPARMSEDSLALLRRLDLQQIRSAREINSTTLTRALGHSPRFRVINPPSKDLLPSHLVLETDDVTGLQQHLSGQQIYCPVHWPPSELLPQTGSWPDRYISLPIDHRYRGPDMMRIATSVKTYFDVT